jgi:Uri superfamily endonuclease
MAGKRAAAATPGFGASDCRCTTHLVCFTGEPDLRLGPGWTVFR